ncbi:hypothetical protein [Clavibacter sp. B3I6]|uniref:hypothetical protein n=1 Tax=Clavibacter sp. B3I6 TaxID=3042268 RepID=UPI0027D79E51|nr:hypothetical protein [Clavibacter sp. B3I6]
MSNKVRSPESDRPRDPGTTGPVLVFRSPGMAAIRDESRPLPGQRQLASLVHDFRGWTLTVRNVGSYGPFGSAEAAAAWWSEHRRALPEPQRARLLGDDWPPGRAEDG